MTASLKTRGLYPVSFSMRFNLYCSVFLCKNKISEVSFKDIFVEKYVRRRFISSSVKFEIVLCKYSVRASSLTQLKIISKSKSSKIAMLCVVDKLWRFIVFSTINAVSNEILITAVV